MSKPAAPQFRREPEREVALNLSPIRRKLDEAQAAFLRAADEIPAEKWTEKASAEEWSAAEIAVHLIMVERAIIRTADRIIQKSPRPFPFWKRAHLPIWLVEARLVRRKSPIELDPALVGKKEEMLESLALLANALSPFLWKRRIET